MMLFDKLRELENLKTDLDSGVARKRGLDFEKLVRDLFLKQGLLSIVKPVGYHTSDNRSEQIDGVINYEGRVFLLEAKWDQNLAASSLYEFIGKIENKFFGTLGIYVSYHNLKENFINALRKGRKQNVIVIHGEDVKLLFEKEISLKEFLKYAIEKLSFDNLSHISVLEFIEYSKDVSLLKVEATKDESKIKEFINSNISCENNKDSLELEVEIDKLNSSEKAKVYLILFKHSKSLLKISFPIPTSWNNTRNFLSIYKPDFTIEEIRELPNAYFSEYIFDEPKTYLLFFLDDFIDEFSKLNTSAKKLFFERIVGLYEKSDWEVENWLTKILEKHYTLYPPEILREVHKKYIGFYYSSSRENRFAQKAYAIHLVNNKKLDKQTVLEWVTEKLIYDLELYENKKEFNVTYFAKTYLELANSVGLNKIDWFNEVKKIYTQHMV